MSLVQKILLVEDAPDMQLIVRNALADRYDLTCAGSIGEAQLQMSKREFSLVLLDIELPDENGFLFCNRLRVHEKHKDTPVIFLSGRKLSSDKVTAFALGAEDYIVKPFDLAEFQARIDAKMRKLIKTTASKEFFSIGQFKISLTHHKAYVVESGQDTELDLRAFEFKLLHYLLRHEGKVVTREQILAEVWGKDLNVTDRTVDTHVYTLRRKLGAHAYGIKTVPRAGYLFSTNSRSGGRPRELLRFNSRALEGLRIPCANGLDLVSQLTEAMLETTPARITRIKDLVSLGKLLEASQEAHGLKSSLRTMGGELAGEICFRMEEEFKTTPAMERTLKLCQELTHEYEKFAQELAHFTGVQDAGKVA